MAEPWPNGLAANPSYQGSCWCAPPSFSFNLNPTIQNLGNKLRLQAGRHQPKVIPQKCCRSPLPLPALHKQSIRTMPYRSPKKTTGQETLTEAQRGNPQTLVPRRAQAHCYRDAETDKTRAGGSRKYKEGLYLVFRNTCIDSTKDTGWLNRQE